MTAAASDKLVRLVDTCDQFRVPIVNFVDQPGFLIGSESERQGTIQARDARPVRVVPGDRAGGSRCSLRKVFGVAAPVRERAGAETCASHGRRRLGSLTHRGAASRPPYRRELEAADDPVALHARSSSGSTRCALRSDASDRRRGDHRPARHAPDPVDWAERAHELVRHELGEARRGGGIRPSERVGRTRCRAVTGTRRRAARPSRTRSRPVS